jgi:hypothetical protein
VPEFLDAQTKLEYVVAKANNRSPKADRRSRIRQAGQSVEA